MTDGITLPPPGSTRVDALADAKQVYDVLRNGGITIVANRVGYGIWAGSEEAADLVYRTKQRGGHKRHALTVDEVGQREIHDLPEERQAMIECVTQDYDLPLGIVAPYRPDNPLIQRLSPTMLKAATASGTIGMLINGGVIHTEVGRLAYQDRFLVFGSSANVSGTGTKFRVEDIQSELREIADLIVDYGLRPLHYYQRSSTIIDFGKMEVIRIGSCYELISDVLQRHFGVELPPDPGTAANPSGHLKEFDLPAWDQ